MNINQIVNLDLLNKIMLLISNEKRNYIKSFKFGINKKLSLFSEVILRHEICNRVKINNSKIFFSKNEYGKPYLEQYSQIHFNISHTKNAIIVAFSNTQIGIDIEKIKKNYAIKIAKNFFTKNEFEFITSSNDDSYKRFYDVWTKKESYIKYNGKGLSLPLNSFDVIKCSMKEKFSTFNINDYTISICKRRSKSINIRYLNENIIEQLIEGLK